MEKSVVKKILINVMLLLFVAVMDRRNLSPAQLRIVRVYLWNLLI